LSDPPGAPGPAAEPERPLPWAIRLALVALGWALILVGIAGLVLPGIQGIATILLGLAVLSLASRTAYHLLHRLLRRWPKAWQRVERFRSGAIDRLERRRPR
jgi:uncharacterized membrane protein YbaN (DUF454 family)